METIQLDTNSRYFHRQTSGGSSDHIHAPERFHHDRNHPGDRKGADGVDGGGGGEGDVMYTEGEGDLASYYAQLGAEGDHAEPRHFENSDVITIVQDDVTEGAPSRIKGSI